MSELSISPKCFSPIQVLYLFCIIKNGDSKIIAMRKKMSRRNVTHHRGSWKTELRNKVFKLLSPSSCSFAAQQRMSFCFRPCRDVVAQPWAQQWMAEL
ncbi:hypothetical protein MLD38_009319 [Melastoma candidum]|uniref:Uncharacterized protein n=1 Tax=Melastoma candidum TaxID=119954 RepID=A0ACB9RZ22_9MYRT|nr:hypothetical protein MLD38_009319 [Melastoma candidum]